VIAITNWRPQRYRLSNAMVSMLEGSQHAGGELLPGVVGKLGSAEKELIGMYGLDYPLPKHICNTVEPFDLSGRQIVGILLPGGLWNLLDLRKPSFCPRAE
jgi:hypothetical protein